jgi:hypothetical protein
VSPRPAADDRSRRGNGAHRRTVPDGAGAGQPTSELPPWSPGNAYRRWVHGATYLPDRWTRCRPSARAKTCRAGGSRDRTRGPCSTRWRASRPPRPAGRDRARVFGRDLPRSWQARTWTSRPTGPPTRDPRSRLGADRRRRGRGTGRVARRRVRGGATTGAAAPAPARADANPGVGGARLPARLRPGRPPVVTPHPRALMRSAAGPRSETADRLGHVWFSAGTSPPSGPPAASRPTRR